VDNSQSDPLLLPESKKTGQPSPGDTRPVDGPPPSVEVLVMLGVLRELEESRGRGTAISLGNDRPHLQAWAARAVTLDQLREAYRRAVAARDRDRSDRPVNAGFLARFVDEVLAPAAASAADGVDGGAPWYESTDPAVIETRGADLGVRTRKPDESIASYRVLVVKASKEKAAVDFVLRDARRFNSQQLFEFAVATFGDELLPTDFYAS
jgi:hypothetical protein